MPLVREWAAMLVTALEHMHAQGVIHRDLRPENIRIAWDGNLKVSLRPVKCEPKISFELPTRSKSLHSTPSDTNSIFYGQRFEDLRLQLQ